MKKQVFKTLGQLALTGALAIGLSLAGCAKKGGGEGGEAGGLININTAPYEELEKLELPGTKPGLDHRIEEHRPYKTVEELVSKGAASQEELDLIKDLITTGDGKTYVPVEKKEGESEEEEAEEKENSGAEEGKEGY